MKASKPYFSHDIAAKTDQKIIRLFFDFRKTKNEISETVSRDLISHAAYGIYWEIIEYLHENKLYVDEIDMLADELRVDTKIIKKILEDFQLFKIIDGEYVSERVIRNLKLQEEKSEKARRSVANRYKNKNESKEQKEDIDNSIKNYNEELVMSIIQIYNEKFKSSRIVSKTNKENIFKIHSENNLTLEIWEKVFSNAKRGWDIKDKKNVKPSLDLILNKWDSFASDDYFLAPDREAAAELEKQKKLEEEKKRAEQAEEARLQDEKRKQDYNAICNKQSALNYLLKYCPIKRQEFLVRNSTFKELSEKYHFSVMDAINYFEHKEDCNE